MLAPFSLFSRFRLNFLLLPCVQQLTSDRGRREARDRRERHSRRRRLLRRVAQLKAAKLRLEEKRNEELTRAAAARRSHPNSGAASIDTTSELQSVQEDLEAAEESLQEAHHDSDSDLEGYKSDELISEEEEDQSQDEDDDDDDDDDESRDSFRPAPPARKPTFVEPVAEDESTPRTRSSRLHHRQPTQSWSRRLAGVKSIYDVTPGMKYSDDYSSADAAAGPPPPFISDHSKEELLFSRIIAIEWSRCGKYVALIGDGPKYPLGVWEISQKEMIGAQRYIGMSAQRVEFRPVHGQLGVVTLGATLLRVWDIKTKFLEHQHTFTSPVKLNEKVRRDRHKMARLHAAWSSALVRRTLTTMASFVLSFCGRNLLLTSPTFTRCATPWWCSLVRSTPQTACTLGRTRRNSLTLFVWFASRPQLFNSTSCTTNSQYRLLSSMRLGCHVSIHVLLTPSSPGFLFGLSSPTGSCPPFPSPPLPSSLCRDACRRPPRASASVSTACSFSTSFNRARLSLSVQPASPMRTDRTSVSMRRVSSGRSTSVPCSL